MRNAVFYVKFLSVRISDLPHLWRYSPYNITMNVAFVESIRQ